MKLKFILLIFLSIKISFSDLNSKGNFKNIEKKSKVLACSYLSKMFIDSAKDYDKIYKDVFKDKSSNELEIKEKISQYLLVNCYLKITKELANNLILEISKGKKDIMKNKKYFELFEIDKNSDINKMKETMKEIGVILKEIKEEEELLRKGKDSPNFDKAYKEFEEKMKKNNNEYRKKMNEKEQNNKKAKRKKSGKKPYEGTKWEIVNSTNENIFNLKDIINNPTKFFEETGINTFCGMIIMSLISINIFQIIYNNKKIKESNINEDKENEEDINKFNNDINNENIEENEKDEINDKDDENEDENDDNNEIKNEK